MTEIELLEAWRLAVASGQPPTPDVVAGLDELFAKAEPMILSVCRRIVGDEERARDLTQDTLLTGYRKLHTFRPESKVSTWLYGIAKGTCLNAMRRKSDVLSEDGLFEPDDPSRGVLHRMRRQEREAMFTRATASLSPLEQEAIHLRYVEELPAKRITAILGLDAVSGARGLLQKSRRRLKNALLEELIELGHGSSFLRVTV